MYAQRNKTQSIVCLSAHSTVVIQHDAKRCVFGTGLQAWNRYVEYAKCTNI